MCQLGIVKNESDIEMGPGKCKSRCDLAENGAQLMKIYRLRQMKIESSFSAALDIVTRCKARYRHGFHGSFSFRFGNHIVAIPIWQGDITQHNVELFGVDHVPRAPGVFSDGNVVAEMIQKPRQRLERVAVILYDENAQTPARIILFPRSVLAHLFQNSAKVL